MSWQRRVRRRLVLSALASMAAQDDGEQLRDQRAADARLTSSQSCRIAMLWAQAVASVPASSVCKSRSPYHWSGASPLGALGCQPRRYNNTDTDTMNKEVHSRPSTDTDSKVAVFLQNCWQFSSVHTPLLVGGDGLLGGETLVTSVHTLDSAFCPHAVLGRPYKTLKSTTSSTTVFHRDKWLCWVVVLVASTLLRCGE